MQEEDAVREALVALVVRLHREDRRKVPINPYCCSSPLRTAV